MKYEPIILVCDIQIYSTENQYWFYGSNGNIFLPWHCTNCTDQELSYKNFDREHVVRKRS